MFATLQASLIPCSATIDSRSIRFGSGTTNEKLLQVPIAAAGELDAHASIRVTVGLTSVSGDSDPLIGISDGVNLNTFLTGNYNHAPCYILLVEAHKRTRLLPLAEYHLSLLSSFLPSTSMGRALVPRTVATSMLGLSTTRLIQQME